MYSKQSFLRSCSSLDVAGLQMGDIMEIYPFQGRMRRLRLNRTKYTFITSPVGVIEGEGTEWILPSFPMDVGHRLKIELIEYSREDDCGEGRYWIKSLDGKPFRLNGVYTVEAWLMRGHILDFANNRMIFSMVKANRDTTFLEEIPQRVIKNGISILLEGETGTGKSHLAKSIHDASGVGGNFVHLNLAAFSSGVVESELFGHIKGAFTGAVKSRRGAFEMANRGTLFLDEIDSLPLEIQTKLLLVIESMLVRPIGADFIRKVETRLIFASGRPLLDLVRQKIFREDFYYRVQKGFLKKLPPLRESPQLMEKIFYNILEKHNVSSCSKLLPYYKNLPWPGNIRQFISHLEKKILLNEAAYIVKDSEDEDLDKYVVVKKKEDGMILPLSEVRRQYVCKVLSQLEGDAIRTAQCLRVSVQTVRRIAMSKECDPSPTALRLFS